MSTTSKGKKPSQSDGKNQPKEDLNFDASGVVAVREDGEAPELISQPFDFRVRYQWPGLVLFHLVITLADSVAAEPATKTTVYLQITADQIQRLDKSNHDTADTDNPSSPPLLEYVRRQLSGLRSVTRLKFRLHDHKHPKLIVPKRFDVEDALEDPAFGAAESLAVASLFSVYFRHDILPKGKFVVYHGAVKQFPDLDPNAKLAYEAMVDLRRMYHGRGGKEHAPRTHRCGSPAPETPASCGSGSTVPFDVVPSRQGYRGSLPKYEDCVDEGQTPNAASEAASMVPSHGADCDLPEYDAEQPDDGRDSLRAVFACEKQDDDARPATKRKRSSTGVRTKATSRTDAYRPEKSQRSLVDQLMHLINEQNRRIDQLERNFEESQRRNEELQTRCDELENSHCELESRQEGFEDRLELTDITVEELEAKCSTLEDRMPDIFDEVRDLMDEIGQTAREDICETLDDNMAKEIEEIVDARLNKVKGKVLKAFQSL